MAGINFLGIKSGSSQSKAHRYLVAKKQNDKYLTAKKQSAQIPCCDKARRQISYCEFARKFKALKSLELPQRFTLSSPLCVCVDTSLALGMIRALSF